MIRAWLTAILSVHTEYRSKLFRPCVSMAAQPVVAAAVNVLDPLPFYEVPYELCHSSLGSAYLKRLSRFDCRLSREFIMCMQSNRY